MVAIGPVVGGRHQHVIGSGEPIVYAGPASTQRRHPVCILLPPCEGASALESQPGRLYTSPLAASVHVEPGRASLLIPPLQYAEQSIAPMLYWVRTEPGSQVDREAFGVPHHASSHSAGPADAALPQSELFEHAPSQAVLMTSHVTVEQSEQLWQPVIGCGADIAVVAVVAVTVVAVVAVVVVAVAVAVVAVGAVAVVAVAVVAVAVVAVVAVTVVVVVVVAVAVAVVAVTVVVVVVVAVTVAVVRVVVDAVAVFVVTFVACRSASSEHKIPLLDTLLNATTLPFSPFGSSSHANVTNVFRSSHASSDQGLSP